MQGTTYTILYVEDDKSTSEILTLYLQKQKYRVLHFDNVEEAARALVNIEIDLAILDVMLPKGDGRDLLRQAVARNIPSIMVTARISEEDRLEGFDLGADDYVCKPYSPRELISRVNALLKRTKRGQQGDALLFEGLKIDLNKKEVLCDDEPLKLTAVEYALLLALANSINSVLSRDQLMSKAWGSSAEITDRAIDTHMANLRKKLKENKQSPRFIATRYGQGYQFIEKKMIL
ncbi:response regulator transcription factor [Microbulbifer sp. OS29]|uniref:Response regulator transcription factor n=1 Tax=Microbulbifer okhotskensis TaxID=2926617 RepID=A0A9X2ER46_9GAMM|nr:response regulator transcription factor [Microbulbifer okhotskensis]MCO1336862.1 response regulator transcription factor [Microbulbifer okhotskensis]